MNNNKLIAEFMELDIIPLEQFVLGVQSTIARIKIGRKDYICPMTEGYLLEHLQYHTSWDWLKPVVDKIESLGYWVNRNDGDITISNKSDMVVITPMSSGGIDMMYKAVVEFIKEYNK